MKFDKNHAMGIEAFLKQLGLNQNYKGKKEDILAKISKNVNKYVADERISLTERMRETHTFPIEILAEVLINPTDKVVIMPSEVLDWETEDSRPYVEHIGELVEDGKFGGESLMVSMNADTFGIVAPSGHFSTVQETGTTTSDMSGKEYAILLSMTESRKREFRITTNLFRKFLNWVRTHKPTDDIYENITEVEEWLADRGTHRGEIDVQITYDHKLTLTCHNKAVRNGRALELTWDTDKFLGSLKSVTPLIK